MNLPLDLPHADLIKSVDQDVEGKFRETWRDFSGNGFCPIKYSHRSDLISVAFPGQITENKLKIFFDINLYKRITYFFSIGESVTWSFLANLNFTEFCDMYYELSPFTESVIMGRPYGQFIFSSFTDIASFGIDSDSAKALF